MVDADHLSGMESVRLAVLPTLSHSEKEAGRHHADDLADGVLALDSARGFSTICAALNLCSATRKL